MKQIRFDSTVFDLASEPNVHVDRMSVVILKGENTVESISNAARNATSIAILEDGEVIGVYDDYNKLISVILRTDQEIDAQGTLADIVSVGLRNSDIQAQVASIDHGLDVVSSQQASQGAQISNLSSEVNGKVDSAVIGTIETIGAPSLKKYNIDDTFMGSDGKYYKATANIMVDSILVVDGNCVETSVTNEIHNS